MAVVMDNEHLFPPVDVIIPVYRDMSATRRCVLSVLESRWASGAIILINDASPDPQISSWLVEVARRNESVILVEHGNNRGFVYSVNEGMGINPTHDVILLNSDTQVNGDWWERLQQVAYSSPDVASVTPFSNNATICSYPHPALQQDGLPGQSSLAWLDSCFSQAHANRSVELPTAVGFCMFIRRAALEDVGQFDEAAFGRGYGEENDFCRRAMGRHWRHLLAAGVFVYHQGSASFGEERTLLAKQAMKVISARYPDYLPEVESFIQRDPLRWLRDDVHRLRADAGDLWPLVLVAGEDANLETVLQTVQDLRSYGRDEAVVICCSSLSLRRELAQSCPPWYAILHTPDLAEHVLREAIRERYGVVNYIKLMAGSRLPRLADDKPVILHVKHGWGGGVDRWIEDYCSTDTASQHLVLRSFESEAGLGAGYFLYSSASASPIAQWYLSTPIRASAVAHAEYGGIFRAIIRVFGVQTVMVSSLLGHSLDALNSGLPTIMIVHDYYPWCAGIVMHFSQPCQGCGWEHLQSCLQDNPMGFLNHFLTADEVVALRQRLLSLLSAGSFLPVAPSSSVVKQLGGVEPRLLDFDWKIIPHGVSLTRPASIAVENGGSKRPCAVVLGRLHLHKGRDLLLEAMPALVPGCRVVLLGCGVDAARQFAPWEEVEVIADYQLSELAQWLDTIKPDFAILASVVPETFGYTLSELWAFGIPPLATRVGAYDERIVDGDNGFLYEPNPDSLVQAVGRLLAQPEELSRVRQRLSDAEVHTCADMVRSYHELLDSIVHSKKAQTRLPVMEDFRMVCEGACTSTTGTDFWRSDGCGVSGESLAELDDQLSQCRQRLAEVSAEMDSILNSRSWRLTVPLRKIMALLQGR